jgi:prevent-host-death family protein
MHSTIKVRKTMKIIGVTELQRHFRSVFDQVAEGKTPYVLTRGSRPEAVLISYEEFLQYQALREEDVLARFDRLIARMAEQNAEGDEKEVAADVEAAISELDADA